MNVPQTPPHTILPEIPMRRQFLAMVTSYAMGTFNDNFFKQAALLLAVTAGLSAFQAQATILFSLPFVLLSAYAGWLADRFSKKNLIIWSKLLEVAAMLAGAYGIVTLHWGWMLAMVCCMGLNSTLFSPALNGSIPELFPPERVPRVNALFKLATTATILLGIALSGMALDQHWFDTVYPFGRWLVAGIAVTVAVVGLVSTFFLVQRPGVGSTNPFPWRGPLDSYRQLWEVRRDPALLLTLLGEAYFYFLSTLLILIINNLGAGQLHFSYTITSTLSVALLVGICGGSLLAARGTPESWRTLLVPATLSIGLLLACVSCIPMVPEGMQLPVLLTLYGLSGICGGLYLIPLTSFIQVRPAPTDKGRILGLGNCLSFTAILLAGQLFLLLDGLQPSDAHLVLGFGTVLVGVGHWCLLRRLPQNASSILAGGKVAEKPCLRGSGFALRAALAMVRGLLSLRYRIRVSGLENIQQDDRPILFLPNHPALIDPLILYSLTGKKFRPRPLVDAAQARNPVVGLFMRCVHAVIMPDIRRDGRQARSGVEAAMGCVETALRQGENVLLYPSGRLTLTGVEELGSNSGVHLLREAVPNVRLVGIRSQGLWGSTFSRAHGSMPVFGPTLLRGAGWLLANLLFFMPRRDVVLTVTELDEASLAALQKNPSQQTPSQSSAQSSSRNSLNRALEAFYNANMAASCEALDVPRHFLLGTFPRPLHATSASSVGPNTAQAPCVPPEVREQVYAFLRQQSGMENVYDTQSLSGDLGVDSLSLVGVSLWIEETFGHSVEHLENLNTVGDCVLAAAGLFAEGAVALSVPLKWFADPAQQVPLTVPLADASAAPEGRNVAESATIPEIIFRQIRRAPNRLVIADSTTTLRGRDLLVKALAIRAAVRDLRTPSTGDIPATVGIMLPASPAAAVVWLAVLLAGKTPVMCNWTTGEQNFRHGLELTGTCYVLTSNRLLERLEQQGFRADSVGANWVALEDMAAGLSLCTKLSAFLTSVLPSRFITRRVPKTAAILFTSGSESLPKAVPLTHANILTNCRDIAAVLSLHSGDRMLGMLPPFHSLGLTGNIVLPLVFGLPVVYHPNPTEGAQLAELVSAYKATLFVSPPSFLDGMLKRAGAGALTSLRLGFVGAEACPESVYAAFAAATPHGKLCEGYGITECAPVVSVNRPEDTLPGTIGRPLPSVSVAVVNAESEEGEAMRRVASGITGMLLVRGANVFSGYLGDAPQPFVEFESEQWYRTGDLVSQSETGHLTFRGRLKRFIKIGGEMISLPQIEQVLLTAFGPTAEATEDGPMLAVESTPETDGGTPKIVLFCTRDISRDAANTALRSAGLSGLFAINRVEHIDAIPVLGTGKTDYRNLKALLA